MRFEERGDKSNASTPYISSGVKYFLDFDGVIFNVHELKQKMAALGLQEAQRTVALFDDLREAQVEISSLVFKDSLQFITAHADSCSIVSSYLSSDPRNNLNEELSYSYQEEKIRRSGVMDNISKSRVYIVGASKAQVLAELKEGCDKTQEQCVFIDDRLEFVKEANELGILGVWMNRTEMPSPEGEIIHEISSFTELEEKLYTWKK